MSGTVLLLIFSRPQAKENSRQYLLLRTDILQARVVGWPWLFGWHWSSLCMTQLVLLQMPVGQVSHWAVTWLALPLVSLVLMLGGFLVLLFVLTPVGQVSHWAATWLAILSPNFPIDCQLSNLYQTFNVTVRGTRDAVSLASRLVLKCFSSSSQFYNCPTMFRFPAFTRASLLLCGLSRIFVAPLLNQVG